MAIAAAPFPLSHTIIRLISLSLPSLLISLTDWASSLFLLPNSNANHYQLPSFLSFDSPLPLRTTPPRHQHTRDSPPDGLHRQSPSIASDLTGFPESSNNSFRSAFSSLSIDGDHYTGSVRSMLDSGMQIYSLDSAGRNNDFGSAHSVMEIDDDEIDGSGSRFGLGGTTQFCSPSSSNNSSNNSFATAFSTPELLISQELLRFARTDTNPGTRKHERMQLIFAYTAQLRQSQCQAQKGQVQELYRRVMDYTQLNLKKCTEEYEMF